MAVTTPVSPNQVIKFARSVMVEYFNKSGFAKYTKKSSNAIIQIRNEQMGKPGMQINFPILRQLSGDGVTGSAQLWGNEEAIQNTADVVTLAYLRNGVQITDNEGSKSAFDILTEARPLLVNWSASKLRKDIISNLTGVAVPTAYGLNGSTDTVDVIVPYASATTANKDTYFANNADRIYAGGVGTVTTEADIGTKATSISTIDDVLKITAAVRDTLDAEFPVSPIWSDDDSGAKTYVWFVDNTVFSQIKSAISAQIAQADTRGEGNELLQNGDLWFDGVVIRLIPELKGSVLSLTDSSSASVNVHRSFICGSQALILAYGKEDEIRTQDFDYEFQKGVAITTLRGVKKTTYAGKNFGTFEVLVKG